MVPPRIVFSSKADDDLSAIGSYIAEHDGVTRAESALARIHKAIGTLALMPGMGSHRFYLEANDRAFPVSPWTIYYRPLADGIRVLRVIDGRRDVPGLFGKTQGRSPDKG